MPERVGAAERCSRTLHHDAPVLQQRPAQGDLWLDSPRLDERETPAPTKPKS
jgi:hypothetical protein